MRTRILSLLTFFLILSLGLKAQDDPVLFTVEDHPIHLSEFEYIYSKTNGDNADFSEASLQEYLDLYVKFKLKVQKAKEMKLDTIPELKVELGNYRQQLANSYLIDKEVTERLVREAYDRTTQDVNISHIMINCSLNALPKDTLAAYNKAMQIKKRLDGNVDFATVAKEVSDDRTAKDNGGNVGFVTAIFPNGFYNLESAAYTLPIGKVSNPVRTNSAYHLVKVNERRPARGEIEAAHILIRIPEGGEKAAKNKVDSVYQVLKKGGDYSELAKAHSQDNMSAKKGGQIGFFGINRYERAFEDAAFALAKDGDISAPVKSQAGWHILKRISRKDIDIYEKSKRKLQTKIEKDNRFERSKLSMVQRIKTEGKFNENAAALTEFIGKTDKEVFYSHKWRAAETPSTKSLFSLGNKEFTVGGFEQFCQKNSRKRMRMGKNTPIESAVNQLYTEFVDEKCMKFEESQLDVKYPEFKALMREYDEGILLFEATKMLVWDKASQDSAGLVTYHEQYKNKYKWKERAEVTFYTIKAESAGDIKKIKKLAKSKDANAVLSKFNKGDQKLISVTTKSFEKGKNEVLNSMSWKEGSMSGTETDKRTKAVTFMKIDKIIPSVEKSLDESRGYVVADYQDHLERQWIKDLRSQYEVKINDDVFKSMIK